jgi:autotransporter-associated beta strand protein
MKSIMQKNGIILAALLLVVAGGIVPAGAQTYETSLTNAVLNENFDELGMACSGNLPSGWVMAEGVGLPKYGGATAPASVTNWTTIAPTNYTTYTIVNEGGASGCTHDISPGGTFGGRINFGDAASSYTNRCLGFLSSNPSWETPTNDFMFGFYNNTGSNILSLAITNTFKQYRLNTTAATVTFYYSLDGTNWTPLSAGNGGPFATGTSTTFYYSTGPLVTPKSFTISGLNISNGSPFYLDWHFVIANSSGSFSPSLGLDDFGLVATLGSPPPPVGSSIWTAGAGSWNTASDWQGSVLPVSANNLIFDGPGGAMNNNLSAVSTGTGTVGFMVFSNSASGSYTLGGNAVTLSAGITNASSFLQTFNIPLSLTVDEDFTAASGGLSFGGAITNGGNQVIFAGSNTITVNGQVTGAGNMVMAGPGQLALNASNSYGGQTLLDAGTTLLGNSTAIPATSPLAVAGAATLNLNGISPTVTSLSGAGSVLLGANTLSISGAGGSFSGIISGAGGLTMAGTGLQAINATNTYQGATTISSGILQIANVATLGTGPLNLNGGTLQLAATRDTTNGILSNLFVLSASSIINNNSSAAAGTRNLPFGGSVSTTGGTLSIQNIAIANQNIMNVRFTAGGINFSQPIYFDDSLAGNPNDNQMQLDCYNTNGSAPQMFSGTISGDGLIRRAFNVAGGGGTTILAGNNTYAPMPTAVNPYGTLLAQGVIGFGSSSTTDGFGNVLSGPIGTSPMEIDNDPFVGFFAYGGPQVIANEIIFNGVSNTYILGSNSLTLSGPINLGLATPKMLTVSNTAPTTLSGSITNTAALIMAGPGTLILTADNSYGTTTVTGGTLEVDTSDGGSGVGTNDVTVLAPGMLTGSGLVGGPVAGNGFIAPGPGAAVLILTNGLDLSSGGTYVWELTANTTNSPGVNYDQIALTGGNLVLGSSAVLSLQFTGSATAPTNTVAFWQSPQSWRILAFSGGAANPGNTSFGAIVNGGSAAGYFTTTADAAGIVLNYTPGSLPAPFISPVIVGAGTAAATISWSAVAGVNYQVQYSTNLAQLWQVLGNVTASGSTASIVDTSAAPVRFYRVIAP